ncbi:hypothetical protein ABE940_11115 [Enterococcus avium]|uniref:hypothetical protein n=1 Tax=Enterococcus avium TaxID=33945 RepID=UPI003D6BC54A
MSKLTEVTKERINYTDHFINNGGAVTELIKDATFLELVEREKRDGVQVGEKVKYTGKSNKKYFGEILEVQNIVNAGIILLFPERDRSLVALEGAGTWKCESFICGFDEVEKLC